MRLRTCAWTAAAPWLAASSTANRASHSLTARAQVADPLAHGMEPAVLELEALAALPHLLAQVGQRLTGGLLRRLRLLLGRLQLLVARHDLHVQRLHVRDLRLDRAEAPDLLLLAPEPGVELAVHDGELADLAGRPIHRLALLLERRGLLRQVVGERLEHGELVLDAGDGLGGLGQRVERALDGLQPAAGLVQPAERGLVLLVDRLEPGGGLAVGAQGVVVLGADPADPLGHLGDLAPQRLGLAPERRDRTLHAQHALDVLPELQRAFDLVAEVAHSALDPVHLLTGARQPLGLPLRLGEAGAERLEVLHLPLDRGAALPQRVQLGRHVP